MSDFKLVRTDYGFVILYRDYGRDADEKRLSVREAVKLLNRYKRYHDRVEKKKADAIYKKYNK